MLLLGEAFEALGNRPQAFYWYLEAKRQRLHDPRQKELDGKLKGLIAACGIEDIDRMAAYAAGTPYAPIVRQQKANIFLEQDELEKANPGNIVTLQTEPMIDAWEVLGLLRKAANHS